MKILIIHNHYLEKGGEDEVVRSEVKLLQSFGHQVILYERSNEEIKNYSFIKKLHFLIKDIVWSKITYQEVKEIIHTEKPDIAHIHNIFIVISPSIYYALSEESIPIIQTLHNYRLICPKGVLFRDGKICEECRQGNFAPSIIHKCWRDSYILSYFLARMLKVHFKNKTFQEKIDFYIALSEFSKNKFIEAGIPKEKIFVKPNFVEINGGERKNLQDFILFIGRLVDYKGINTLISALRNLGKYQVKIIGNGPLKRELKDKVKDVCNIQLLGNLDHTQTIDYIRKCRFVVLPSQCYENMPLVIMESFACAVPVIVSRLGAMAEYVENGRTGLHFTPGDVRDLASKIEWAWRNPNQMERMGKEARRDYQQKYVPQKNYHMLMQIYKRAIENKKSV